MVEGVVADCPVKPTIWVKKQRGVSEDVKKGMGGRSAFLIMPHQDARYWATDG
jgi:hypothetical protein